MSRHFLLAFSLALITGCGGGGSSTEPTQPPVVQSPLTPSNTVAVFPTPSNMVAVFSPTIVSANYKAGTTTTVSVNAKIISAELLASETAPFLYIVDSNKVLAANVDVTQVDADNVSMSFKTSAALAQGHYSGTFQIQLCKDANCSKSFAGSPITLAYDFTVTEGTVVPPSTLVPVSFKPAILTANYNSGTSATLSVQTTINDPKLLEGGTFYVSVVDPTKLLTGKVNIAQIDATHFSVSVYTSPTTAKGRYQDTFQIQLCKDVNCVQTFAGSPVSLPYDFTVVENFAPLGVTAVSSTTQTMYKGGAVPSDINIAVTGAKLEWTAVSNVSWLTLNKTSGVGDGSIGVHYNPTSLAVGSYNAKVTVNSKDGQSAAVNFTLEVFQPQFSLLSGVPTFTSVNGALIAAQQFSFELNSKSTAAWSAVSSAPWLLATPLSGTSTPAKITLQPDPSKGKLASGSYSANVVLSSSGVPNKTITSQLTLTKPVLSAATNSLTFGGTKGRDFAQQSLRISLNTDKQSWPWTLSGLPSGVTSSQIAGTVNQDGVLLYFTVDPSKVAIGSHSYTVNITAQVNGDSVNYPLTLNLNVDQRKLLMSDWGIAFTSKPNLSLLTRTLKVRDNYAGDVAWTAVSDSSWLNVTSSGTTTSSPNVIFTANPASLPLNTVSYANVTLSSSIVGVKAAVVRVGLWKDNNGAVKAMTPVFTAAYANAKEDKIRPYIYVDSEGSTIDIYNIYTAKKVGTINAGVSMGAIAVSPDGNKLYAIDLGVGKVFAFNLNTLSKVYSWDTSSYERATNLTAVRTNGNDFIFHTSGGVYSEDKTTNGSIPISGSLFRLIASSDGMNLYSKDPTSYGSVNAYTIDYSDAFGGGLMMNLRIDNAETYYQGYSGFAISPDGSQLYIPNYSCNSFDASNLKLTGGDTSMYAGEVAVAYDGRVICAGRFRQPSNEPSGFSVFSAGRLGTVPVFKSYLDATNYIRQVLVSSDGLNVVSLSLVNNYTNYTLAITPLQ